MKIEEYVGKPREQITQQDIISAAETYDWEFIEAKDAFDLYALLEIQKNTKEGVS